MQRISSTEYTFGEYSVRSDELVLRFRGRVVALAPKVVATFIPFLAEPGRVISKPELMERIWPGAFVEDANLTQNIYILRKMFEVHASAVRIENVPKRGYRFAGPLASLKAVSPATATVRRLSFQLPARLASAGLLVALIGAGFLFGGRQAGSNPFDLAPRTMQEYLLGRHYLQEGTPAALRRSIGHFTVVARDAPNSALGFAGLSESNTSLSFVADDAVQRAGYSARAVGFARQALHADGTSAEAYAAIGAVEASIEHDDASATAAFNEALRLDSRNLDALVWRGTELLNRGDASGARGLFERALAVDPNVPGSVASLAWADFLLRDFGDAAAFSKQLIRAHQLEAMARMTLASADVERRNVDDALPEIQALNRFASMRTQAVALRSQVDAMRGRSSEALNALQRLEGRTNLASVSSWDILSVAAAYARLGRGDAAFVLLERIQASERQQLARDPRFDALRRDKRFAAWLSS